MTETTLTPVPVPDDARDLLTTRFRRLDPEAALQPCDGHASRAVNAVAEMIVPSGRSVLLCGNCARKAGWEHTKK